MTGFDQLVSNMLELATNTGPKQFQSFGFILMLVKSDSKTIVQ
jgi:hypothetical protein